MKTILASICLLFLSINVQASDLFKNFSEKKVVEKMHQLVVDVQKESDAKVKREMLASFFDKIENKAASQDANLDENQKNSINELISQLKTEMNSTNDNDLNEFAKYVESEFVQARRDSELITFLFILFLVLML